MTHRVKGALFFAALVPILLLSVLDGAQSVATPDRGRAAVGEQGTIVGAWRPETYILRDGTRHDVDGYIFFTEEHWTVLFFVVDEGGTPQRGSAEGGTYDLEGDRLVFTHFYNLSGANEVEGLAAAEFRMRITAPEDAASEPCRIELDGDRLTIHFPSGNHMTFRKVS